MTAEYEGSQCQKATAAATLEQLEHRKRYAEMAVYYWATQDTPNQDAIKFFQQELALIDKRIKEMTL